MNIDKILNNPLINRSALARLMYPNMLPTTSKNYLNNKIQQRQRQTLTYKDRELIKEIIKNLLS